MTTMPINFNGIKFNITCEDKHLKKLKKLFSRMIPISGGEEVLDYTYNIHYIEDINKWNSLEISRSHSIITPIRPNLEKFNYRGEEVFYSRTFYYVTNNGVDYYVYTNDNKYAPYYVMLELIQRTFENNKYFIYHGTGININDTSINIIGNSGSGKTTLMSKLFQTGIPNKEFLSNDRIIMGPDYTSAFPIEVHLDPVIVEHDPYLRKADIDESGYVKPSTLLSVYPDVKSSNLQKNNVIVLPKIDIYNKNHIYIHEIQELLLKELFDSCFTVYDRENPRDYWLMNSKYTSEELLQMITELNKYLIENYRVFELTYGCDLSGEEIYESIKSRL